MQERREWKTARGPVALDVPRIMGIVNVTPDSFYDGGRLVNAEQAIEHALSLVAQGADLIDIGGESTRPGARPISAEEELGRIMPVIQGVLADAPLTLISVDTVKSEVARAAVEQGVAVLNDVSGLRLDPAIADVAAASGAGLVLMHSRGGIAEMASYATAEYSRDPTAEISDELGRMSDSARECGVEAAQIVIDPGIGFSKRTEHSVAIIARLSRLHALGYPILLGPSRKRFIGELTGGLPATDRLEGTIAACAAGLLNGARIFRVHDVQPVRRALLVAEAIRRAAE
jgi:dihydropteroate synthase